MPATAPGRGQQKAGGIFHGREVAGGDLSLEADLERGTRHAGCGRCPRPPPTKQGTLPSGHSSARGGLKAKQNRSRSFKPCQRQQRKIGRAGEVCGQDGASWLAPLPRLRRIALRNSSKMTNAQGGPRAQHPTSLEAAPGPHHPPRASRAPRGEDGAAKRSGNAGRNSPPLPAPSLQPGHAFPLSVPVLDLPLPLPPHSPPFGSTPPGAHRAFSSLCSSWTLLSSSCSLALSLATESKVLRASASSDS